jgi:hypothetical protein
MPETLHDDAACVGLKHLEVFNMLPTTPYFRPFRERIFSSTCNSQLSFDFARSHVRMSTVYNHTESSSVAFASLSHSMMKTGLMGCIKNGARIAYHIPGQQKS